MLKESSNIGEDESMKSANYKHLLYIFGGIILILILSVTVLSILSEPTEATKSLINNFSSLIKTGVFGFVGLLGLHKIKVKTDDE